MMNVDRLENVVRALRDAEEDDLLRKFFTMDYYGFSDDVEDCEVDVERAWSDVREEEEVLQAIDAWNSKQHGCGTPACAVGHYAARKDLQDQLILDNEGSICDKTTEVALGLTEIAEHFGLTILQGKQLFSYSGCNYAKTPGEAADYIESFIDEHTFHES